jgi:Ca2+-transporting ATPase
MIIADDNFATIVSAVEEGRNIYANMQTFVCFLISCNIGEIATMLFATLLGIPEPLTPLHLLWVNLVTDGPPATALGFNPPDANSMMRPPRARHEASLSPWLLGRYVATGLYVGFATIGSFVWWYLDQGEFPLLLLSSLLLSSLFFLFLLLLCAHPCPSHLQRVVLQA